METCDFKTGALVFAKVKGYPHWPGRIESPKNIEKVKKGKYWIYFFGTHEYYSLGKKDIFEYSAFKDKYGSRRKNKGFNEALIEIEEEYQRNELVTKENVLTTSQQPIDEPNIDKTPIKTEISSDTIQIENTKPTFRVTRSGRQVKNPKWFEDQISEYIPNIINPEPISQNDITSEKAYYVFTNKNTIYNHAINQLTINRIKRKYDALQPKYQKIERAPVNLGLQRPVTPQELENVTNKSLVTNLPLKSSASITLPTTTLLPRKKFRVKCGGSSLNMNQTFFEFDENVNANSINPVYESENNSQIKASISIKSDKDGLTSIKTSAKWKDEIPIYHNCIKMNLSSLTAPNSDEYISKIKHNKRLMIEKMKRRKLMEKLEKKKRELNVSSDEQKIRMIDVEIKKSLRAGSVDHHKAYELLEKLESLNFLKYIQKIPDLLVTLKKIRHYKDDEQIRTKANILFVKCKDYFKSSAKSIENLNSEQNQKLTEQKDQSIESRIATGINLEKQLIELIKNETAKTIPLDSQKPYEMLSQTLQAIGLLKSNTITASPSQEKFEFPYFWDAFFADNFFLASEKETLSSQTSQTITNIETETDDIECVFSPDDISILVDEENKSFDLYTTNEAIFELPKEPIYLEKIVRDLTPSKTTTITINSSPLPKEIHLIEEKPLTYNNKSPEIAEPIYSHSHKYRRENHQMPQKIVTPSIVDYKRIPKTEFYEAFDMDQYQELMTIKARRRRNGLLANEAELCNPRGRPSFLLKWDDETNDDYEMYHHTEDQNNNESHENIYANFYRFGKIK